MKDHRQTILYPAPATARVITGLNLPTTKPRSQLSAAEFQVFSLHSLGEGQSGIKIQSVAIIVLSGARRMVKLLVFAGHHAADQLG